MASDKSRYTHKMLSYRRAMWLNETPGAAHFEHFVRQALAKLQTVSDTAITRDSG